MKTWKMFWIGMGIFFALTIIFTLLRMALFPEVVAEEFYQQKVHTAARNLAIIDHAYERKADYEYLVSYVMSRNDPQKKQDPNQLADGIAVLYKEPGSGSCYEILKALADAQ